LSLVWQRRSTREVQSGEVSRGKDGDRRRQFPDTDGERDRSFPGICGVPVSDGVRGFAQEENCTYGTVRKRTVVLSCYNCY
jgi:hypothetical protein